jgi:hypothetical protein
MRFTVNEVRFQRNDGIDADGEHCRRKSEVFATFTLSLSSSRQAFQTVSEPYA